MHEKRQKPNINGNLKVMVSFVKYYWTEAKERSYQELRTQQLS